MIKNNNVRVFISLSKNQTIWLEKETKEKNISKTDYILMMMKYKFEGMKMLSLTHQFKCKNMEELIKIAKTKWLD